MQRIYDGKVISYLTSVTQAEVLPKETMKSAGGTEFDFEEEGMALKEENRIIEKYDPVVFSLNHF